ncbi:diacylglycerol/lipid kinase family protein [Salsipaludibacter albus]|uniref:diacylglycerol/lipid kinase family protein n=1 Tax=Salsipaludibacter albus TaxID=2849650 RepID=UPI001EE3BA00|nr:YegS/Rv2252/BmrU family lipid kinase [Salsipaludibacter albus]
MSTPAHDRILVVANPAAGRPVGRGRPTPVETTATTLRQAGRVVDVAITRGPGEATRLAREAIDRGVRHVVAVGGDGTLHEVLNGLVDPESGQAHAEGIRLGLVSAGSGSDFARTFGLDRAPTVTARHLLHDTTMAIDVGRVRLVGPDGTPGVRAFANVVSVGWPAAVVRRSVALPRSLGALRYVVAGVAAAPAMRTAPVVLDLDHTRRDDPVCSVVVANGQFFGGGLKVAPRALPDDGRLNVQSWETRPVDVLRELPRVRMGEHFDHPGVREWQTTTVTIRPEGDPLPVEADGEFLGTTPATVDLLPGLLHLTI